ncbi:WD40-repeat-containing domain protein [Baffinella frigidus]|nr:WD40-repeat-containing domain protein [Cryptophyta sp. CCMP2293]
MRRNVYCDAGGRAGAEPQDLGVDAAEGRACRPERDHEQGRAALRDVPARRLLGAHHQRTDNTLKYYSPAISAKEFLTPIGRFTRSVFIPYSTQAVSATEDGDLLLWDQVLLPALHSRPTDRCAIKLLRMHEGAAVTVVSVFDNFLVTAAADGFVRFYDFKFRLLAWYEDLDVGPITALTFTSPQMPVKDATVLESQVRVPNFVVASSTGKIALVNAAIFEMFTKEERRGELLVHAFESHIAAICAHPLASQLFVVTRGGMLRVIDYESQAWLRHKVLEKRIPTCICINPNGQELVVGCTDGSLLILNTADLDLIQRASQGDAGATKLAFAPDGMHIAIADTDACVGLYRRERNVLESGKEVPWLYVGRYRSHHAPVVQLAFVEDEDAGVVRLVSLGRDRVLVEYDLSNSFAATGIVVRSAVTIEQTAVPTSLVVLPPGTHPGEDPVRPLVVSANDEYKLKVLDVLGLQGVHDDRPLPSQESHCVQTLLGPTYGPPPHTLAMLPVGEDHKGKRYCVYSTPSKVVGLIKLPFDGNPNKGMGLIAHPGGVEGLCVSHDGRYVLTTGGSDFGVMLWEVDTSAIDAAANMGGSGIEPYEALIPGGKEGEFYDDMCDYFYLAQLRAQGENTTAERQVTGVVPVDMVPDIMRALGYYPSNFDVRDFQHEVLRRGQEQVDFATLLKLFVNHKPVREASLVDMKQAFEALGAEPLTGIIKADALMMMLKRIGEPLGEQELNARVETLQGRTLTGRENLTAEAWAEQVCLFRNPFDLNIQESI